jgi:hypothetical protein
MPLREKLPLIFRARERDAKSPEDKRRAERNLAKQGAYILQWRSVKRLTTTDL